MTMTDSVMLDYWNGRPSLWLSVADGEPYLPWLMMGYTEPHDVWLHMRLDWDSADTIVENPPERIQDFLDSRVGAPARLVLETDGRVIAIIDWTVPTVGNRLSDAFRALIKESSRLALINAQDAEALTQATAEMRSLIPA